MADLQQKGEILYQSSINDLESLYKALRLSRNNPNHLYNSCFEGEPTLIDTPLYNWQWIIEDDEYKEIKNILSANKEFLKEVINTSSICCKLLHLYISEWYKREYNGNDGKGNALASIGVKINPQKICNKLACKVYTSYENCGDSEWLYSLYIDGGLPLNYLINKDKENNVFKRTIESIIEISSSPEVQYNSLDELNILFPNGVVNQSYSKEESIFHYINEAIICQKIDQDKLHQIIDDSRNDIYNKSKFEVRYDVFKSNVISQIRVKLFLKSEPLDYKNIGIITKDRLSQWRISTDGNSFFVSIKKDDCLIWKQKFYKNTLGHFTVTPKKNTFDLRVKEELCTNRWTVFVGDTRISNKSIRNRLSEDGYIQMYSNDGINWSSVPSNNYRQSAVLFDKAKEVVVYGTYLELKELNDTFGWIEFGDRISFKIDESMKVLCNKSGVVIENLTSKGGHALSKYLETPETYLVNSNTWPLFDINVSKTNKYGEPIIERCNDIQWFVRRTDQGNFVPIPQDKLSNLLNPGFFQLKVRLNTNNQEKTINCFALRRDANIKNVKNDMRTDFNHFDDITILENGISLRCSDGSNRRYWRAENSNKGFYLDPYAKYILSRNEKRVTLKYPKPIDCTVLKNKRNGSVFAVAKSGNEVIVPIISINRLIVEELPSGNQVPDKLYTCYSESFQQHIKYDFSRRALSLRDINHVLFKTYTHSFKWRDRMLELSGNEKDIIESEFVLAPVNDPLNYRKIELAFERQNNNKVIVIGKGVILNNVKDDSILIQLLHANEPSHTAIKPAFIPGYNNYCDLNEVACRERRNNNINRFRKLFSSNNYKTAVLFFELATKTGNYYGSFDSLLGLADNPMFLVGFLKEYKQYKDEKGQPADFRSLWRLADEFLFDWFLIPTAVWREGLDNINFLAELLRRKPNAANLHSYFDIINDYNNLTYPENIRSDIHNKVLRTVFSVFQERKNSRYQRDSVDFWRQDCGFKKRVLEEINKSDFWIDYNCIIRRDSKQNN